MAEHDCVFVSGKRVKDLSDRGDIIFE